RRGRQIVPTYVPCDCKLCGAKFESDEALGYHIRDVHVVGVNPEAEDPSKKRHNYKRVSRARGNRKLANPKRPHECPTCGKRYMYESSLTVHEIKKHEKKVQIEGTDEFYSESNLPKPYEQSYICDQCGKILLSKHSLDMHQVSAHGTDHEKPFQCDICGQRFVKIRSLINHRRKEHTGDQPFVCEYCGKAFAMKERMKQHLRVHSDEKIYKCTLCSKEFKSNSSFAAHKDLHAGIMRYTCKYCGRKFQFQGNMGKHIKRRHPNGENSKPFMNNDDNGTEESNSLPANSQKGLKSKKCEQTSSHDQRQHHATTPSNETNSAINSIASQSQSSQMAQTPTPPQQHSQGQSIIPTVSFQDMIQPETHLQVLSTPFVPQHTFNGLSYQTQHHEQQPHHLYPFNTVPTQRNINVTLNIRYPLTAGGCRFCQQHFSDIRQHLIDFHKIPVHTLDANLQDLLYYVCIL
ncbi:zinc finger protein 737-like protein, partial [Leptotrombidium deliense]